MKIVIEDKSFETAALTQLYPAAIVKTGYEDETTQMSLEWLDVESKGKVEVAGFGIFVHVAKEGQDDEKHSFIYKTRQEMEVAVGKIAKQLER